MAWYLNLPWIVAQAANAAKEVAAEPATDETSVATRLLAAVAVIVGSFVLGSLIARWLRLPEFSFRIGIILFALIGSVAVNVAGWPPKRGIDLSGGVVLVYEVDKGLTKPSWMPTALSQLNSDLNEGGGSQFEARPAGPNQIEIVGPPDADMAKIERAVLGLRSSADLTLHAAGKRTEDGKTVHLYKVDDQHKSIEMDKLIAAISKRINPGGIKELTIRQYGAEQIEVIVPEIDEREVEQIKKRISTSGMLEFRIVANETDDADIIKAGARTPGKEVYIGGKLVGRWVKADPDLRLSERSRASFRTVEGRGREVLVRIDAQNVDGRYLTRASKGFDQGRLAVNFSFDSTGADKFGKLTSNNLPDRATEFYRHLGIVLDDTMISAPQINDTIRDNGQITGDFTDEYVDLLVGVLNAGSLPATLRPEPISQQRISAQLGDDTIRKGTMAIVLSTAAILLFMAVYYRFCGIVADLAVTLNLVITVAAMILIKAAFTLPGLAGMVLTVGMAVDANVLIYERMREELERGASLRMAIRNGFSRAMATIIDSHVTTLMSAIVLYIVGTDQIKGFAVTLIVGLLMSLFTAVFVSRVIFDIAERKKWLTKLRMMSLIGHTNIDFIRWLNPAIAASVLIIAVGLVAAVARGKGLLDIDFTGGSSVAVLFDTEKPHDIADVRKAVAELPDVAVSSVGDNNLEFKVDTSEPEIKVVQQLLQEKFPGELQTYSMSFDKLAKIEPKAAAGTEQAAPEQPAAEPAAEKPTEEKPAEQKPAEEKPAETPKSSGYERPAPRSIQVASVGVEQAVAALFAAQDAPAEPTSENKPAEPAAETKPADPVTETKPAEQPPAAAETKPEEPKPEVPAEKAPETPAAAAEGGAAGEVSDATGDAVSGDPLVGGTSAELSFPQPISYDPLRELIDRQLKDMKLENIYYELRNPKYEPGSDASYSAWTLRIALDQPQTETLLKGIQQQLATTPVFPSSNQIGGKVAGDTQLIALYALLASMVIIVIYVWFRFENLVFGLASVLALVHDVLVAVAFIALSSYLAPYLGFLQVDPFKISLSVVAALLTIVGFSINDTIVVFDRIREVRGKSRDLTPEMINVSINQTLSRTVLTSGTVLLASIILYFVGGPGIHAFAFCMVIGGIAGTYSSIYIAAPMLLWMRKPVAGSQQSRSGRGAETSGRNAGPSSFTKSSGSTPPAA
jgi:SecD/SecF fusion protein